MQKTNPQAMFEQAKKYYEDEHWKDALHLLDELAGGVAIQKDVMFMRAMCLARMGNVESAEILCDMLDIVVHDPRGQQLKPYINQAKREERETPKEKKKIKIPRYLIPGIIVIAIIIPAVWFGATFVLNHIPEPVNSLPAIAKDRTVRFGKEFSTGKLSTRKWTYDLSAPVRGENKWKDLADAFGNVIVPLGLELRLVLYQPMTTDLSGLRRLKANDLQALDAKDSAINDEDMGEIAHLSGLRYLRLDNTRVTEAGMAKLTKLNSLQEISAAGVVFGEEGWKVILSMPYLHDFSNDRGEIVDKNVIALCASAKSLDHLSLDENTKLTDASIKQLKTLPSLTHLYLSYTGVTDEGVAAIQELDKVYRLYFEGTAITDACMAGFQKMRSLKILSVARTQITDAGLEELMKVRQLEKLDLSACHYLSKEAIAAFREALPDCEVETLGNVTDRPAMWDEPK